MAASGKGRSDCLLLLLAKDAQVNARADAAALPDQGDTRRGKTGGNTVRTGFGVAAVLGVLLGTAAWAEEAEVRIAQQSRQPESVREADATLYDEVEPFVEAAPVQPDGLAPLPPGHMVRDIAVSPIAPEALILAEAPGGRQTLLRWRIGHGTAGVESVPLPLGPALVGLAWHPKGTAVFATAGKTILRLDPAAGWKPSVLWQSPVLLGPLVAGPRPFEPGYRLFFVEHRAGGRHDIGSLTEKGSRPYAVTTAKPPKEPEYLEAGDGMPPHIEAVPDAQPQGFHPGGHVLVWSDAKGCFSSKHYFIDNWEDSKPLNEPCGGSLAYTPNGTALLHWWPGQPGVEMVDRVGKQRRRLAGDVTFTLPPRPTADGRGLVAAVAAPDGRVEPRYIPVDMPLADVTNAWMFLEGPEDQALFAAHGGVFRPFGKSEQLYQLYDSESYACGGGDTRPARAVRPYLVTTDIFWEVFAAAYQGIFIAIERQRAMPDFAALAGKASAELAERAPGSRMARAFAAVHALMQDRAAGNEEAARIAAAEKQAHSPVLDAPTDYRVFRPRGHYEAEPATARYFQAVRYLATIDLEPADQTALARLSPETRELAVRWTRTYRAFIAPSRAPLGWTGEPAQAAYASRPAERARLFPLSWGWDNEAISLGLHHDDRPMRDRDGAPRLLGSGLDLAMATGSPLARGLLAGEFGKYPDLEPVLTEVGRRFADAQAQEDGSLYARWIGALALQWAKAPEAPLARELWDVKRLQTGLASWATLRHATVLVNEVDGAECGEAGFEAILMKPPRGYVEPDPAAFAAIVGLFDVAAEHVRRLWPAGDPLAAGILRRLAQSRDSARRFGAIAAKEVAGAPLSPADYADIQYVGRAAEHNFLVFHSLNAKDNALSRPVPIMKVAEVAGNPATGWLEAAVGRPQEWDAVVPAFGRRDIVKGSVYAYHELVSDKPMSDADWLKAVDSTPHPPWLRRYTSPTELTCPPKLP